MFPRFSSLCRRTPLSSPIIIPTLSFRSLQLNCSFSSIKATLHMEENSTSSPIQPLLTPNKNNSWKPLCLYYTQGKCTKMDEPSHTEMFSHDCSSGLGLDAADFKNLQSQKLDFFLVLDLEGKVEILEFPVLLFDAKTMSVVDFFHRFVRPSKMTEQRINEYIEGKYGKLGVDRVWHDTAIPFHNVIQEFEDWLVKHRLWGEKPGGLLNKAAFVTCGNWDVKTKIPQQCEVSNIKLPSYFMEWINLKDSYLNFYKQRAPGMLSMMRELNIPLRGSHHLGIDDAKNITRVLQRLLTDGASLQITARRYPDAPEKVKFLFRDRIK
ncbi:hypothetical protein M9H77_21815 [Catharanthus roseus]|uniref:Uncharacterized protein n=1 Tax=Catharanthus roseus TaxID=4058 RepID=A0ACC0AR82_CATRO|nr:hypothetical protein M9H77_21815 [Catharanthus roseus]